MTHVNRGAVIAEKRPSSPDLGKTSVGSSNQLFTPSENGGVFFYEK